MLIRLAGAAGGVFQVDKVGQLTFSGSRVDCGPELKANVGLSWFLVMPVALLWPHLSQSQGEGKEMWILVCLGN